MFKLFSQGGPFFMGILTLILLGLIAVFILAIMKKGDESQVNKSLQWMKSIGTLGLVLGILGQLIGLYSGFEAMETNQGISPAVLAGGLKVSMITTMYGIFIYIIHIVLTMVLKRIQ